MGQMVLMVSRQDSTENFRFILLFCKTSPWLRPIFASLETSHEPETCSVLLVLLPPPFPLPQLSNVSHIPSKRISKKRDTLPREEKRIA